MKKRTVALMLCAMMAFGAAGCGAKDADPAATEATESAASTEGIADSAVSGTITSTPCASSAFDLRGSDYVTLCDYSAIPVTITGDYDVDDQKVKDYFKQMFDNYGPFYTADPDKTTVEEGDIVNVDYVGKLDGTAFSGGTAENQNIDVYQNASATGTGYIDGFTDGLKGASVGDVIDCDVTFPDDYGNTDLAGKAVVFTFTVNSIQKEMTIDDVDDTFAKEQFQVDTVDEMYDQIRSYMESSAEYNKQKDTTTAVQNYLIDNCEAEVPEDYLTARVDDYRRQYIEQNCNGDESQLADYVSTYYGKTVEEMEAYWNEGMEKSIRLEFIMDAIADELGVEVNQDDIDTYAEQLVSQNGYESVEAMYDQIRSYMESSAEYNKQKDTTTAVQNYLIDNCEAEVPEDYLTARVDDYRRQYIEQNCNGDESQLADYVSTYYGKTVEEMEAYWNEGMEKSIRLEFIMDAIADELGVEVNQDDIDTYAEQLVSQNGYESVEAMYNIYGFGDTDYGKRYFADLYRYDQALDQLLETAVVTIDPSADTESDAVTEDAADATEAGSATNASTTYEAAEGTEKTGAAN